jgi:hypothetical protein
MDVYCECCVLSVRGLCDELIVRTQESYRLWCVVRCVWSRNLQIEGGLLAHWGAVAPKTNELGVVTRPLADDSWHG